MNPSGGTIASGGRGGRHGGHVTVSAIYSRSLASGDLLIPASVAAGHAGMPPGYSQILVSGGTAAAGTWLVAGAAAGAVTLLTVTRAVTGSLTPFIPLAPAVGLVAAVAALTAGAVMIPFGLMARREPTLASG